MNFFGCHFHMNTNMYEEFQICISVPLTVIPQLRIIITFFPYCTGLIVRGLKLYVLEVFPQISNLVALLILPPKIGKQGGK